MNRTLLVLLLMGYVQIIQAQQDTVQSTQDTTTQSTKKNTFTLAALYTNNANYYGQRAEENIPYVALAGVYKLKSGLYFTGSALRLLNDSARLTSATSIGMGYNFNLSKKLVGDISYSHNFYPKYSPFLQAANNNMTSASLNYQYFLKSGIGVDYNFGKQSDFFTSFTTSKDITLGTLFSSKDGVSIEPGIEVVAGTQRFYTTYVEDKIIRDELINDPLLPPILGDRYSTTSTETITTTKESSSFNLISYNFKLPLNYYRKNYLVELNYQLSVLSKQAQTKPGSTNSFFTLGFYYQF